MTFDEHTANQVAALQERARCLNPTCRRFCAWRDGKGRPPAYCSNTCRVACQRRRVKLADLACDLEEASNRSDLTTAQRLTLSSQQAKVRWHIARLPQGPAARDETPL